MKKKLFPLRTAVTLAMLTALAVVLDRFVPVVFTDSIRVTLTFVPAVIAAMNNRQKKMGYNTAEEFNRKLLESMGGDEGAI